MQSTKNQYHGASNPQGETYRVSEHLKIAGSGMLPQGACFIDSMSNKKWPAF